MTTSATSSTSASVALPVWIRGLIAAAVAAVVNVVIRLIASAAGADMLVDARGTSTAVTPAAVLIATTLPIVLGGIFVWLVARRTPRAQVVFAWVGLILGVATIPVPLLSAPDIATGLSLAPMHVVAGAAWFSAMMLGQRRRAKGQKRLPCTRSETDRRGSSPQGFVEREPRSAPSGSKRLTPGVAAAAGRANLPLLPG